MKNTIKFISFLIYSISIFFIDNYTIIIAIVLINMLFMLLSKVSIKDAISNLIKLLPFILFTCIINIVFVDFAFAILIGIRLIIVCNVTYTFSKNISYTQFSNVIQNLTYPLKSFGVNPRDIGIIVTIALSFMPIMKNELQDIKNTLKAKGVKINNTNLLKNANLIFKPFFVSVLQRLNELEATLKVKGYQ